MVPYLMQDQNDMELQLLVKPTLKFSKVDRDTAVYTGN